MVFGSKYLLTSSQGVWKPRVDVWQCFLVGGFNPSEKYARQIGNLPQIEVKIKNT